MGVEDRKKILHKNHENPSWSHGKIAKSLGIPRSTVSDVLRRFRTYLSVEQAEETVRKAIPVNKFLAKKIIKSIKQNPDLSDGNRAERYGRSRETRRKTRLRAG